MVARSLKARRVIVPFFNESHLHSSTDFIVKETRIGFGARRGAVEPSGALLEPMKAGQPLVHFGKLAVDLLRHFDMPSKPFRGHSPLAVGVDGFPAPWQSGHPFRHSGSGHAIWSAPQPHARPQSRQTIRPQREHSYRHSSRKRLPQTSQTLSAGAFSQQRHSQCTSRTGHVAGLFRRGPCPEGSGWQWLPSAASLGSVSALPSARPCERPAHASRNGPGKGHSSVPTVFASSHASRSDAR